MEFLNHHRQKFDCGNYDLDNIEGLIEYSQPEIPAQMPGIDLEVDQDIDGDMIKIIDPRKGKLDFE